MTVRSHRRYSVHTTSVPLKPALLRSLRTALETGDSIFARELMTVLAGDRAVRALDPRDTLKGVKEWLDQHADRVNP